jgi:hypothetical protein
MVQKASYDVSAWKLQALTGPDPSDDFSQDAAKNKRPKGGVGNSEVFDPTPDNTEAGNKKPAS